VIIDSHAHLVSPSSVYSNWAQMESAGLYNGHTKNAVTEAELRESADRQIALMDEVATDMQLTSPRPYLLKHSHRQPQLVKWWVADQNDAIAVQARYRPDRIRGVAGLPQIDGEPVDIVFDELERCVNELDFVGVLLNPDPGEGNGRSPVMCDPYWYPLYERLEAMDVPALLHCAGCNGRENYSEHFISEESLAIYSLLRSDVFERFPGLKLIVPHGGGSVPYQLGRWVAHEGKFEGLPPEEARKSYVSKLRKLWYDTCLYTPEALELLVRVVGSDRVLFGTERPGSGYGLENVKPMIDGLESLTDDDRALIYEKNAVGLYQRLAG
jgi:4-oxalmesaconate hydratase